MRKYGIEPTDGGVVFDQHRCHADVISSISETFGVEPHPHFLVLGDRPGNLRFMEQYFKRRRVKPKRAKREARKALGSRVLIIFTKDTFPRKAEYYRVFFSDELTTDIFVEDPVHYPMWLSWSLARGEHMAHVLADSRSRCKPSAYYEALFHLLPICFLAEIGREAVMRELHGDSVKYNIVVEGGPLNDADVACYLGHALVEGFEGEIPSEYLFTARNEKQLWGRYREAAGTAYVDRKELPPYCREMADELIAESSCDVLVF